MQCPLPPMTHYMSKIGNFSFFKPHLLSPKNLPIPLFSSQVYLSGKKIDIIAEKSVIFRSKFPTSKCNSKICHSLRGLTYMSVWSSSSSLRKYYSHTWVISGMEGAYIICLINRSRVRNSLSLVFRRGYEREKVKKILQCIICI